MKKSNVEIRKIEITNPAWETLNLSSDYSTFLSSAEWLMFQQNTIGKTVEFFGIYLQNQLVGILPIYAQKRKFLSLAYSAFSPVLHNIQEMAEEILVEILKEVKKTGKEFAKKHRLNVFRFDLPLGTKYTKVIRKAGFLKSLAPAQAKDTWVTNLLDLDGAPIDLLQMQNKDTRYYIKRAEKLGTVVKVVENEQELADFISIMNDVQSRKNFKTANNEYYKAQWKELQPKNISKLWIAYVDQKPTACALINYYKTIANYAYGGSTSDKELQKIASPYALQYRIMKNAQENGFLKYNFWGAIPKNIKTHNMRTLSDFKMKFYGKAEEYTGPFEIGSSTLKLLLHRIGDYFIYKKERY